MRHEAKKAHDAYVEQVKSMANLELMKEAYNYSLRVKELDKMQEEKVKRNPERIRLKRLYGRRGVIHAMLTEKFGEGVNVTFDKETRKFTVILPEDE